MFCIALRLSYLPFEYVGQSNASQLRAKVVKLVAGERVGQDS
jgi:hypothetical protein